MLRAPSGTARALASAISAATPVGVIGFPAAAQQVAAGPTLPSGPDFASCDARFKSNPAQHAQCYHDASIEFSKQSIAESQRRTAAAQDRTAAAQDRTAAAQKRIDLHGCLKFLTAFDGPLPPITAENACPVAISKGHVP